MTHRHGFSVSPVTPGIHAAPDRDRRLIPEVSELSRVLYDVDVEKKKKEKRKQKERDRKKKRTDCVSANRRYTWII